jgi:hypothetical protein
MARLRKAVIASGIASNNAFINGWLDEHEDCVENPGHNNATCWQVFLRGRAL